MIDALRAVEQNEQELFLSLEGLPRVEVRRIPGATLVDSGVPIGLFNGVFATDAPPRELPRLAAEATEWFGERRRPWSWRAGPGTRPADLVERLLALGFTPADADPAMRADLRDRPPELTTDVLIEPVDEASFAEWFEVLTRGFEMPPEVSEPFEPVVRGASLPGRPMRHLLARDDGGDVVATASIVVAAGVAGLFNIATDPEHRGRRIGRDITIAAMAAGRDAGCPWAVLTSSESGFGVYRRLGFVEVGARALCAPPG